MNDNGNENRGQGAKHRPIAIETLADLRRHSYKIVAHCKTSNCSHSRVLDLDTLIERFGPDCHYVNNPAILNRLACKKEQGGCGTKGGAITIMPRYK
ncbi:MAG: hypothetical protein ABJN98_04745 [Roseibium sp.]